MSRRAWHEGQRVRFARAYADDRPPERPGFPPLSRGTVGVITRCFDNRVWVKIDGIDEPATLWFQDGSIADSTTTDILEALEP